MRISLVILLFGIVSTIELTACFLVANLRTKEEIKPEYTLNLEFDHMEITDRYNKKTCVPLDSLDEWLVKDNL